VNSESLQVKQWPLARLKPYERNAKKHPADQIEKLAAIIARHGFDVPIVVEPDGTIIKGHGRLLAAKKLKLDTVPVIVRGDLSLAQIREARLADNRVTEYGWDFEALLADVSSSSALDGFDVGFTAFGLRELGLDAGVDTPELGNGAREIDDVEIGEGSHECPRCSFKFD